MFLRKVNVWPYLYLESVVPLHRGRIFLLLRQI